MTEHKLLSPCPFCGEKLFLDIDEGGGVAILHSLKEKNCFFPSILEIEMPVGTTLEQMIEKINRRPIQESFEHAIVGASLVSAARIQDKVFEIQDLKAELAELRERTRWIPTAERLPEVEDGYCVSVIAINADKDDTPSILHYDNQGGFEYLIMTHWIDLRKLIESLPLPEPPEATDADN